MSHYFSYHCITHDETSDGVNHGREALQGLARNVETLRAAKLIGDTQADGWMDIEIHVIHPYGATAALHFLFEHTPGPEHDVVIRSEYGPSERDPDLALP